MFMEYKMLKNTISIILALLTIYSFQANAAQITMTFEGLADGEYVREFYNGGLGGSGSSFGDNYGVSFPGSTFSSIDADAGGTGNFGGEPSSSTAISFQQSGAWMNVDQGFSDQLSFYYSNPNNDSIISIYDGTNGSGNLLATLFLPTTAYQGQMDPTGNLSPLILTSVSFIGIAKSVDFVDLANSAYVDDIALGATVPAPAAVSLFGSGLIGLIGLARRKSFV